MADQTFVRAYTRAALEEALEPWSKALRAVQSRLDKSADGPTLDDPAVPFDRKQSMLNARLPSDTPPPVRNFIFTLASRNHLSLLPEILHSFDHFFEQQANMVEALVTSAIELKPDERARLEAQLKKQHGENLDITYEVDPALLGGLVVRVGDYVIDGSVAGKLAALRTTLETTR